MLMARIEIQRLAPETAEKIDIRAGPPPTTQRETARPPTAVTRRDASLRSTGAYLTCCRSAC